MGHKGHWGEYTGNAKWSRDHAHTRVTSKNYDDAVKDDAAHIDYLKRDIDYDAKHGHSDEKMTADEKHISKLAGDMKYDKEHHGSAAKHINKFMDENHQHNKNHDERPMHSHKNYEPKKKDSAFKNKVEGMTHEELAKFSENRPVPAGGKTGYERHMEMHNSAVKQIDPREDKESYEYDYDFAEDRKASKRKAATQMHCMGKRKK